MSERNEAIDGLQQLVDFLRQNPAIPAPTFCTLNAYVGTKAELAVAARMSVWEKLFSSNYFSLRKEFPGPIYLEVYTEREKVCRKVVTGTRVVPARPAQPECEEPVEEWICDEASLLADQDARRI